ncbi:TPA: DNA cytosine methyltransferase [Escherichia coli]|nr:DNA cytosine methyltransferase [Escherichia coli]HCO6757421.1 DNA cytosine methyltransferase [Escherichia coli]HCP0062221.1 DNA cytosine methyltransferase [Escherichia coli]
MTMTAYYNEIDPYAAQWLRNLIDAGEIAPGYVDERSIEDVTPGDLRGFTQHHFFAGIGVWSYALRKAGWPDNKSIWTGSCPCQPFSSAGKGKGVDDERHLWPAFFWLIEKCNPGIVIGEQVASADGLAWLDLVQTDLEGANYTSAGTDICAAGFGSPHIRQRLYWVAYSNDKYQLSARNAQGNSEPIWMRETSGMANSFSERCNRFNALLQRKRQERNPKNLLETSMDGEAMYSLPVNGFWRDADWLYCRDEKYRPVRPGSFPMVNGIAKSLGRGKSTLGGMAKRNQDQRIIGYGNAINAEVATAFVKVCMEVVNA